MAPIKQLLARLSVAVFGLSAATAMSPDANATIDQATLIETLAAPEVVSWGRADRARLLRMFAADPRPAVRAEVARHVAELPPPVPGAAIRLLAGLSGDASVEVADAVACALAVVVDREPGVRGASLTTKWALSSRAGQRRAIAAALERPVAVAIAESVLAHLASDPCAEVRRAVARAAWARRAGAAALYEPILERLSGDPDATTRETAQIALGRA